MKNIIITTILILSALAVGAKTVQTGVVREYKGKAKKTALAGVELQVYPAQSTASDRNGNFRLEFLTLKPGERINVRRIEKEGYEIFNKDALEQWNLNPTAPFMIVMCRSNMFKQLKDTYYKNSGERYARQYRKAQDELKRLKDQNKIQQKEYIERLEQLEQEYGRQLENLDNYVDRFARIDLSEVSPVEQEIIELVQAGKIDEAIAKYEELNAKEKLLDGISKRKEVGEAISTLTEVDRNLAADNDTLYAVVERQIQTLQLGGAENNEKIRRLYCDIADADTTNIEWLIDTGNFLYEYAADHQAALGYFHKALASAEALHGPRSEEVAKVMNNLGVVCNDLGEFSNALDHLQRALDIRLAVLGEENNLTATTYNNIGNTYLDSGDPNKALEYFQKAFDINQKVLDSDDPALTVSYNDLGNAFYSLGDYGKALEYLEKALEIQTKIYSGGHLHTAATLNNIGMLLSDKGDYQAALDNYFKALAIQEKIVGPGHPDIAISYNNIGSVYYYTGDFSKALEYFRKALDIRVAAFGEKHPSVGESYSNTGVTLTQLGNYDAARENLEKSLEIYKDVFGNDNEAISVTYINLADLSSNLGDFQKALEYQQKALEINLRLFGPDHPQVALSYNNIGTAYGDLGEPQKALEYLQKALDIRIKLLGNNHPYVASGYNNIGTIYNDLGNYDKALEYYHKAIDSYSHNEENPECAQTYNNIGVALAKQGKDAEALDYKQKALELREQVLGINHPDCRASYFSIALSLIKLAAADTAYQAQLDEFMADKVWTMAVAAADGAATAKGLTGEYVIFALNDWRFGDHDFYGAAMGSMGKPKEFTMYRDGNTEAYRFDDDRLGMGLYLVKVTSEEKARLKRAFEEWQKNNSVK